MKVIIGVLLGCIIIGSLYVFWSVALRTYKLYKVNPYFTSINLAYLTTYLGLEN